MNTVEKIGTLTNVERVNLDDGGKLEAIWVKLGANAMIKIWFNESNLFYERFTDIMIGKRYKLNVTEEPNGRGGIKYRLISFDEIKNDEGTETGGTEKKEPPF